MTQMHSADPRARRLALVLVAIGFVAAALLLWALESGGPAIARWLKADPAAMYARARLLIAVLALLMAGPPVTAGAYLWRFGSRVIRADRFPPPDARLVQDMLVLTGDAARTRGRIAQGAGFLLVAAGLAMALLLWRLGAGFGAPGR